MEAEGGVEGEVVEGGRVEEETVVDRRATEQRISVIGCGLGFNITFHEIGDDGRV